jgi:hypothetical protein
MTTGYDLHLLKAFALCVAVLGTMRTCRANAHDEPLKAALDKARELADYELRTQRDEVPFERFFSDSLMKVIREARETPFRLSKANLRALEMIERVRNAPPDRAMAEEKCIVENLTELAL